MLTKQDLDKVEEIVKEEVKFLPTTDVFLEKMDEVMGELRDLREEVTLMNGRVSIHSDQIDELEKIHPSGIHAAFS